MASGLGGGGQERLGQSLMHVEPLAEQIGSPPRRRNPGSGAVRPGCSGR